jgi:alkylation response protein AidB-like acyl-CoA dehydrogenase
VARPVDLDTLRATARSFAREHVIPTAMNHDRDQTAPLELVPAFAATGIPSALIDAGPAYVAAACGVSEEIGYGCAATASLLMLPVFFNRVALALLDEPTRSVFASRLARGPIITAFAASERDAGSDLLGLAVSARRTDDGWRLNGRKEYSSNVRHAQYVIVVARTALDDRRSSDALTWFLVETVAAGISIGDRWPTLGLRAMDLSPIDFDDVRVSTLQRLGEEGRGLSLMAHLLSQSRTGIAAMAIGIARRARDEVLAFGARRTIGGERLIRMQDYRFRIADMEKDIAAARGLVAESARLHDAGHDHAKAASIAKLYAGEMVMRVTESAVLMLGSAGYTGQSVVEKLFRDARHVAIVEGPEPTHRELIFASMLRHGGD